MSKSDVADDVASVFLSVQEETVFACVPSSGGESGIGQLFRAPWGAAGSSLVPQTNLNNCSAFRPGRSRRILMEASLKLYSKI